MVLFAIVALISNLLLPLIVSSSRPKTSTSVIQMSPMSPVPSKLTTSSDQIASASNGDEILPRSLRALGMLRRISNFTWLTLPRAWGASNIFTSLILLSTCFTNSPTPSILLVSVLGISWALTQWAPLALINASLAAKQSYRIDGTPKPSDGLLNDYSEPTQDASSPSDGDFPSNRNWAAEEEDLVVVPGGLEAGAVMGVYNAAIAAPQLFAAMGSSGMFWILTKTGWEDNEAVGWVIRIGGLAGLVAAWLTLGLERDEEYD
jgi:solute carrier family 45 protein 1/2/4